PLRPPGRPPRPLRSSKPLDLYPATERLHRQRRLSREDSPRVLLQQELRLLHAAARQQRLVNLPVDDLRTRAAVVIRGQQMRQPLIDQAPAQTSHPGAVGSVAGSQASQVDLQV